MGIQIQFYIFHALCWQSRGGSRLHSPILGLLDDQLSDENLRCQCQWNSPPKKGFDHQPIQRLEKREKCFREVSTCVVVSCIYGI